MTDANHSREPLAIVGMSCRLPGGDGLSEFWNLVRTGGTAWGPLPESRLNRQLYFDPVRGKVGKTYSELGAVVADRPIDTDRCPIPDAWFDDHDIAHLIACEVASDALRNAGYDPFQLRDRNVGVYVGHTGGSSRVADIVYANCVPDMARVLREIPSLERLGESGQAIADAMVKRVRQRYPRSLAGVHPDLGGLVASVLISRLFGLTGPHLVVDAACASSFQALALASRALRQGRIKMAIVGGASYCKSDSLVLFSQAQSVSNTGSCPFSANADGLVTAEGYVMFAIKTLAQAEADGDKIQSVIRGVGVSSDGKGKSLWAPRQEGQVLAVHRAYEGGLDFSKLQYIEAHATSTQVGDATELGALSTALRGRLPDGVKIPIGSIKGNVGHTLETAGVAGMIKTILAMQNGVIPPAVRNGDLNREVVWEDFPFYVPFQAQEWPEHPNGSPRRAAVNAFGIGGLNVHVVLDEYHAASSATTVAVSLPPPLSEDDRAVAIVGAGCVLPGAYTLQAFWDLLVAGEDPKSHAVADRFDVDAWLQTRQEAQGIAHAPPREAPLGGFIKDYSYDWRRHKVPPKQVAQANPLQFMLLDAADQAFHDGGFDSDSLDRTRVGVVVGARFGGDFSNQLQLGIRLPEFNAELDDFLSKRGVPVDQLETIREEFRKKLLQVMPSLIDETGSFTSSTLASRITKTFNLMGGALALDAGSCSALAALQSAMDILREGSCDMVVCAAGQRSMDSMIYTELDEAQLLNRQELRGAFDREAQGLVPGEGCGVVLLKRLSDARRDGDRIRGVIRAVSACHANEANPESISPAMHGALVEARIAPDAVVALEPAAYAVPAFDRVEARAIRNVYAEQPRPQPLWLGALRGQLGDLGAAAGMAGLLKAALALEHHTLPPTPHVEHTIPELETESQTLRVANRSVPMPETSHAYAAVGVTATHGDLSYHAIIDNGLPLPAGAIAGNRSAPVARQASVHLATPEGPASAARIFRCEANSLSDLIAKLATWTDQPQQAWKTPSAKFLPKGEWRCAIVAASAEALERKSAMALSSLRAAQPCDGLQDQGIFVARRPRVRPSMAVLFPGQGSQYLGMLKELCATEPAAQAALKELDQKLISAGFETFADLAWGDGERLGKDVWQTQASMLVANLIGYRTLMSVVPAPQMVAAHSFGEFPALVAAGFWDFETAAEATRSRCMAVAGCSGAHGAMLSVFGNKSNVEALLPTVDEVWMCAENGPDQVVVGGQAVSVERFGQRLAEHGIKSRFLAVPCPFHTPLLADACPLLEQRLQQLTLKLPNLPFASGTLGRFVSDPAEIRQSLVRQLVEPVKFRTVVEGLYSAGARVLVEIGPNSVLTQLSRRTLADRSDVMYLHLDHKGRSGFEQWLHVRAGLEVLDLVSQADDSLSTAEAEASLVPIRTSSSTRLRPQQNSNTRGRVVRFDATARRREAMRSAASAGHAVPGTKPLPTRPTAHAGGKHTGGNGSGGHTIPDSRSHVPPQRFGGNGQHPASPSSSPKPEAADAVSAQSHGMPAPAAKQSPAETLPERALPGTTRAAVAEELQAALVAFIVDQTGYPEEIVELDADLEADLGIDSIKKAQLFGELGERYQLAVDPTLTLDDFNSLQTILDYLLLQPSVVGEAPAKPSPTATAQVATHPNFAKESGSHQVGVRQRSLGDSNGSGKRQTSTRDTATVTLVEQSSVADEPATSDALHSLLVEFVVEQTGYPADIVDLDADLESDLGIDSIKKAQLFGEIGERFHLTADPQLSLDSFPTLRHVHQYLQGQLGDSDPAITSSPSAEPPQTQPSVPDSSADGDWDLDGILVNFVVEQTGYPAEMIDLDADLESDLGIDSIKKAQLFGEIGEQFQLVADPSLSLNDFATLRHVKTYMRSVLNMDRCGEPGGPIARQRRRPCRRACRGA